MNVLIVEDDRGSRDALVKLLRELQFKPRGVSDLKSARRALSTSTPDILILDLMLPDGNGAELLAEIRKQGRRMKVAVVTAAGDHLKLHEVTRWNPDALFGKPIDVQDFNQWLLEQRSKASVGEGCLADRKLAPMGA